MVNIHTPKNIKAHARAKLKRIPQMNRVMLFFCGILLALCVVTTLIGVLVDSQMEGAGGLGNMGTRAFLSTISTILPFANTLGLMVLDLGLLNGALRVSRGQYVSENTLRAGLDRFFPMLRLLLLQAGAYIAIGIAALNISSMVYFLTPFSNSLMELVEPLLDSGLAADPFAIVDSMTANPVIARQLFMSILPIYVIFAIVYAAAAVPVIYKFRFSSYVLLDDPRSGALRSLTHSWKLTKGCCIPLFKLDISYWWYHVLMVLCSALSYGYLLPGPLNNDTGMYIFYAAYLLCQVAVYYFFRPQVEVASALVYDSVCPKEKPGEGQVLGNIFQN